MGFVKVCWGLLGFILGLVGFLGVCWGLLGFGAICLGFLKFAGLCLGLWGAGGLGGWKVCVCVCAVCPGLLGFAGVCYGLCGRVGGLAAKLVSVLEKCLKRSRAFCVERFWHFLKQKLSKTFYSRKPSSIL